VAVTPWTIRPIEEGDAPEILLLARSLDKWFNAEGLTKMSHDLRRHEGFVAVRGIRLVGFVTWEPLPSRRANLSWMGVAEAEQGRGIGKGLLEALVRAVRREGVTAVEVSTVADAVDYEPYERTRAFYRAMGFVDERVDPRFWGTGDDRYDRLVLRLDVAPGPDAPDPTP